MKDSKFQTSACAMRYRDLVRFFIFLYIIIFEKCCKIIVGFGFSVNIRMFPVELSGILYGLDLAWRKGFRKLIVEIDSHSVITIL